MLIINKKLLNVQKMSLSKNVRVFDIKRYSIKDGPGIRITLFFKGCPLSCVWCHNPEGISSATQRLYTQNRCIGCSSCVVSCEKKAINLSETGLVFSSELCESCGDCVKVCPSKALELAGEDYTVDELLQIIDKETLFFDNSDGGGVTFCGGEPFMQHSQLLELLKKCRERDIHTVIDTTLYTRRENLISTIAYTDLYLVDLKMMDSDRHKRFTGVDNRIILENIKFLSENGGSFWIRIPLIEGVNSDEENIRKSAEFIASLGSGCKRVELLPYHDIAKSKHERLGTIFNPTKIEMSTPSQERIDEISAVFSFYGLTVYL